MDRVRLQLRRLTERVMKGGQLPLALLLEVLVPVRELRRLTRELGLAPKGGFRTDKAPARVLAPLLAERQEAEEVDRVVGLLLPGFGRGDEPDARTKGDAKSTPAAEPSPVLRLREEELVRVRHELERAREGAVRAHEREAELRRELDREQDRQQRLRAELNELRRANAGVSARPDNHRDLLNRIHDLEQEIDACAAADEALRRQLAQDRSRMRELEEELAELEPLVPKGRRRKRRMPPAPPPEPVRRFVLPYFASSFYRSLAGKDRKSIERAVQAVLLLCTEGHAYPGLEVKQLGGLSIWSLRASLGLRVYFRSRSDGDVELLELADREEQRTTLRRLKER